MITTFDEPEPENHLQEIHEYLYSNHFLVGYQDDDEDPDYIEYELPEIETEY